MRFLATLLTLITTQPGYTPPDFFTEKIETIPDYYQRDKEFGGFPRGGAVYCGPVAVSNSLFWFSQNGYQGLIEPTENKKKDLHNLISTIGSSEYINTSPGGASPDMICNGVQKFLNDRNFRDAKIKFYGWRPIPPKFKAPSKIPDLEFAKKALLDTRTAVWLNIGWYSYNERKDEYKRTGGHWVTLVGYGHNGKNADSEALIIHDPETRWRLNDYIKPKTIASGVLTGKLQNMPQDAKGYAAYSTGLNSYGIIEGMVVLEMPKLNTQMISRSD